MTITHLHPCTVHDDAPLVDLNIAYTLSLTPLTLSSSHSTLIFSLSLIAAGYGINARSMIPMTPSERAAAALMAATGNETILPIIIPHTYILPSHTYIHPYDPLRESCRCVDGCHR